METPNKTCWTPGMWSDPSPSDNSEDEAEPTPLEVYNKAISQIAASGTGGESPDPLTF